MKLADLHEGNVVDFPSVDDEEPTQDRIEDYCDPERFDEFVEQVVDQYKVQQEDESDDMEGIDDMTLDVAIKEVFGEQSPPIDSTVFNMIRDKVTKLLPNRVNIKQFPLK